MKKCFLLLTVLFAASLSWGQEKLPVLWEELTSPQFKQAVERSGGVCVIPLGVIERHGAHLPIGCDVFEARYISQKAAEQEYCIVFPYMFAGVVAEAKHHPGTLAWDAELLYKIFDKMCEEIGRNGITKILIYNHHGGNPDFLRFFCRTRLNEPHPYAVYLLEQSFDKETTAKDKAMRKNVKDGHAGEQETSQMLVIRPDLVHMELTKGEEYENLQRINTPGMFTAIRWYASFPNHLAGDPSTGTAEYGQFLLDAKSSNLAKAIKALKEDDQTLKMYKEYYEKAEKPWETTVVEKK